MKNRNGGFDFIVVGAGLAGLYSALEASKHGSVALITKSGFEISSSYWAQGGIAAVLDENDSFELHIEDTINAGKGLCNENAVKILVAEGSEKVKNLIELGMPFDTENGNIVLGLEGGHSHPRILHAGGDSTGREIINFLTEIVKQNDNIEVFENCLVYHLIASNKICTGVDVYNWNNNNSFSLFSSVIILATGGCSAIYERTTNPYVSMGEGIALAYNIGADVESMEFIQFHPTAFYSENGDTFLISEAVRGEGATLLNDQMERFMLEKDELAELATRDIISQSIYAELKRTHKPNVYLDMRHLDSQKMKSRFSNIYEEVLKQGFDFTEDLIPVTPAAHYMIGGIKTGLWGETNIKSLYAVGEIASTGIHGANRLASNSLLECLVFASRAVEHSTKNKTEIISTDHDLRHYSINEERAGWFNKLKLQVASVMTANVGVVRIQEELNIAINKLSMLRENIPADENEYYSNSAINLVNVALLITTSALIREESRGCHFREDFNIEEDKKYIIAQNKFSGIKFMAAGNE
jgi:L-aspartate oxidase